MTHISPLAFGEDGLWGGGERYPRELAREMSGIVPTRLVVFGPTSRRYRIGRLQVCQLASRGLYKGGSVNPLSELLPLYAARTNTLHLHQYHSVVTNVGLLSARLSGRPAFCTDYGGASYNYADRLSLERFLTGFLPVSHFSASFFPQLRGRVSEPILGGVDVGRFHPDGAERERQVVYVVRLLPHKGVDVLIRALDDRTPCRIFGRVVDPAYRAQLQKLASGKDVVFNEKASDRDIAEAYRRSRVAVLPSVYHSSDGGFHPWSELLGLTLLEAMACGTPVVASRVGGIPEIVTHGQTGYLVEPGDVEQLGQRIAELLEPSARWQSISACAVETVRARFTWRHVAERCLAAYDELSGARGARR